MIGDDAIGSELCFAFRITLPGEALRFMDKGPEEIRAVVGIHILQDSGQPLETHAGIYVLRGECFQVVIALIVVLDENQIPDLSEASAIAVDPADVTCYALLVAGFGTPVVMNLGAGTTRTGLPHFPEVILTPEGENVLMQYIGLGAPVTGSFFIRAKVSLIVFENRCPEAGRTSYPTFRRTYGGCHRAPHHPGRCACRRHAYISAYQQRACRGDCLRRERYP